MRCEYMVTASKQFSVSLAWKLELELFYISHFHIHKPGYKVFITQL